MVRAQLIFIFFLTRIGSGIASRGLGSWDILGEDLSCIHGSKAVARNPYLCGNGRGAP